MLEASHFDVNEAYAAVERHQLEDYEPHIYRTHDAGKTWTEIINGFPKGIYVQTVKEDPQRRGLLFAGTERAVLISFDDGDHWQSLQLNLPPASMRDLAVHGDDLVLATHGRGFWVLDDITALRQIGGTVANLDVFLFKPAEAFNITPGSDYGTPQPRDEALAENPPFGAMIHYYLKSNAVGPVTVEILDPSGEIIRRYSSDDKPPPIDPDKLNIPTFWVRNRESLSAAAGMHRWIWDLRPTPPAGSRTGALETFFFGGRGPVVMPGTYSVKLTVGGKTYSQPLTVRMDPRAN